MGRDAVTSVHTMSNLLLGLLIVKEVLLIIVLFFYNQYSEMASCGLLFLLAMVYFLVYIIGIPLCIQIFRSGSKGMKERSGWKTAGVIVAIGLAMPFMAIPFFPLMFGIAMYIYTYKVMENNRMTAFKISLFLFITANLLTFIGFMIRDLTDIWVMGIFGTATSLMFFISHVQHISLNRGATRFWNARPKYGKTRTHPRRTGPEKPRPAYSYYQPDRIISSPEVKETKPDIEPVVNPEEKKPRILEAPPGYD